MSRDRDQFWNEKDSTKVPEENQIIRSRARKERKRATKRKIPKDGEVEEATSLKRSIESIEKQGEKLAEIMRGLQENQSKQLEMVASFMGSLVEAIKDKK